MLPKTLIPHICLWIDAGLKKFDQDPMLLLLALVSASADEVEGLRRAFWRMLRYAGIMRMRRTCVVGGLLQACF